MNVSWPQRLGLGDRVRLGGRAWVVSRVALGVVELTDPFGDVRQTGIPELVRSADFDVLEQGPRSSPIRGPSATEASLERARWWERHIVEVITGLPFGADPENVPRAEYDPAVRSLREREEAKASELRAAGVASASARTVRRRRQHYQVWGLEGLIDGRAVREPTPGSRQDPRVLKVLLSLVSDDARQGRTYSAEHYRQATAKMLKSLYGSGTVALPSRSTFQRLVNDLVSWQGRAEGIPVVGAAGIRLSRPGERVHVSTVPLALPSRLAHLAKRPLLMTVAMDELTWSVCTLMVYSSRQSLDAPLLLARLCNPPVLRDAETHSRGPEFRAVPLIIPESLVLDRHPLRRRRIFMDACRELGIHVGVHHPSMKLESERITTRLVTLLNAELANFGADLPSDEAALTSRLQVRAEQWVESVWQHQPQWALQEVAGGWEQPTPSSAYEASVARLGWVHLPPGERLALGLLPSVERRVGAHGIEVRGRRYDSAELRPSGSATESTRSVPPQLVQTRFDPHDIRQVWVDTETGTCLRIPLARKNSISRPPRHRGRDAVGVGLSNGRPSSSGVPAPSASLDHTQERLAYHARLPVLQTPFLREVLKLGDRLTVLNRTAVGGRHGLLITGPPRSGKTTALQELERRFTGPLNEGLCRGRVVRLRLHPADNARTVLEKLADSLDLPSLPRSVSAASDAAREALLASGTAVVLVDDAFSAGLRTTLKDSPVDALCFVAEQVPTTFVYTGTEEEGPLTVPGTLAGRLAHLAATPMPYGKDWVRLVEDLDDDLRLRQQEPGALVRLASVLHTRTGGWAGTLAHLVRSAAIEAILTGREEITEQDFDLIIV
ncbi:Mu transposase C-terminal domain-containing protein [Streptomyces cynarae]|uniref:Mu transposase C-terminal domain-containing protein n=1 Tax=Streptomyces cynarae TaxID=2981134 RepID=A0ABY6E2B1_9ACTN|nr:Mu transposase C-terminal domain-containing protein [Streptomyces cynarae]UXY20387.1 Mu transposase C-terminal domain-containing protein [Streptomyces cynarae]